MVSRKKEKRNEQENEHGLSALDAYLNRVFRLAILAPSIATLTAAVFLQSLR